MVRIEISVGNVTYIPVTYKANIDGQTFWLIFLALNIRANERETVTYKPKGVYKIFSELFIIYKRLLKRLFSYFWFHFVFKNYQKIFLEIFGKFKNLISF